jgi:hypothetical protein
MSIEHPGDGKGCDHCGRPGQPYTYRGREFSGLHANRGELLCSGCLGRACDAEGVNILVIDGRLSIPPRVVNTVRDADLVFPRNPVGTPWEISDGRDRLRRPRRKP